MRKSVIRGFVSILLTVCFLLLSFSAVVSAENEQKEEYPFINVPGFMGNDVYRYPGTDAQETLFPPTTEDIMSMLKDSIAPLSKFVFDRDWNSLGNTLAPIVYNLLSPVYNNPNGTPDDNTGPDWSYPDADTIKADGDYKFEYDWRLDPVEIAAQLKEYVDYIKKNSGASKVDIRCHSMGGVVMLCYINQYGYDDLDAVMYDTTAIYGETFNGELFTNQIELSDDSITSYMRYAFFGNSYEVFFNNLFDALYKLGIIDSVCDLGNVILEHTYDDVAKVVVPMFAYYPGIWAMIPDEYIPTAREYVFGELLAGNGNDYSELEAKLDYYDTTIRAGKTEKLLDSANYMRIGVISRYNFSAIPATKSWYTMSDGTVDSKSSSFGATYANYGETLDEAYISSLTTTKYLSPDKVVDASTALFPDNTWFVKDLGHSKHCATLNELTDLFFDSDDGFNVFSDARFPQFMICDPKTGDAFPLDEDDVLNGKYTDSEKQDSSIFGLFKRLLEKFIAVFENMFASFGC